MAERDGTVMLDEHNRVLRPSIIWCDQRTGRECEEITERVGKKRLIEITANPALTGFTASKILWVRNHEPEIYAQCRHILLPKDYVRFRMTGEYATEVSDASGMQLPEKERPTTTAFDSVPLTVEMMRHGVVKAILYQHPIRQGRMAVSLAFEYLVNGRMPEKKNYIMKNEIRLLENL